MRTARATQKQANMALEVGKSALLGVIISFVLVVLYAVALKEELLQVFRLVNNYLYPGGIFIFDFNTDYKYREVIGNTTIAYSGPPVQKAAVAVWGAGGYALRCTGVHSVFRRCGHAVREHSAAL